jgi:hypothetical protein
VTEAIASPARDKLAGQLTPPGRRTSEAAAVHVHGSRQQPDPDQLAGGLLLGTAGQAVYQSPRRM